MSPAPAPTRVLITGASSGIGAALARRYAARGARLILAARRLDLLEAVAAAVHALGGEAIATACDVARDGEVERAVAAGIARFGGLDIAIANAGFGVSGPVVGLALDDYRRLFETNVFGVLRTARAAHPALRLTRGRFAVMGSVMGHIALPGSSPYAMSKFAVRALAMALRDEWRADGIAVTLISPGFVDSDFRRTDNAGRVHAGAPDPVPAWLRGDVDAAARAMVRAIDRRARERVITLHGKALTWAYRHAPGAMHALIRLTGARRTPRAAGASGEGP
ncbi:MAG TPA: SDR family NAD(P)-dependent oxidoreductase [Planctomycetota bacterium]|nr:SDR family NAD(P)-dependent oxidoreductase [Planctomycetota bacterium]